jgi:hypothetical protein
VRYADHRRPARADAPPASEDVDARLVLAGWMNRVLEVDADQVGTAAIAFAKRSTFSPETKSIERGW